jgi:hypothetical protein
MRRTTLTLLVVAFLAGCGQSGSENDEDQEAAPVAAQAFAQRFDEASGMPPLETAGSDPSWEQLGLGLDLSPAEQKRYGTFTIYVVDPGNLEAVSSLLADKDTGEPLEPDAEGIYWDYDELAKSQVAQKRYGSNVVLAWWNEKRKPGTDARWEQLDQLVQQAVAG